MQISFAKSEQSTLGIEWELALVDAGSLELSPRAPIVLDALGGAETGPYRTEFLSHMVELVTGVHRVVGEAVDDLRTSLSGLYRVVDPLGIEVLATGTHPFSRARDQEVVTNPRYTQVLERSRWWGQRLVICGTHVHVGVDRVEKVIPILNGLTNYLPLLLALSASSPFWEGEDTGYASQRTMLFQQLPSAGLPDRFQVWNDFERYVADLKRHGIVQDTNEVRWDVRPSPGWGTIENRVLDAVPTLSEIGCLAALTQCLVEHLSRRLDERHADVVLPPWLTRENKWRAARYGLDAQIIGPSKAQPVVGVRDAIIRLLEVLDPVAADLGCSAELRFAEQLCRGGSSYLRQLAVIGQGGNLHQVVRTVLAETRSGTPRFS